MNPKSPEDESSDFFEVQEHLEELGRMPNGLAVHKAILDRDHERLRNLLDQKVALDVKNQFGFTPLQVACLKNDAKSAEILIRAGCDITANGNSTGKAPISLAAFIGDLAILDLLINHGASVHVKDNFGCNPLHDAILGGHIEIIANLLKIDPKLSEQPNNAGRTPQHLASLLGSNSRVIGALLRNHPLVDSKDESGRSVLDLAKSYGPQNWKQIWEIKRSS